MVAPDIDTLGVNRRRSTIGVGGHYLADAENRQKFRADVGLGEDGEMGVYIVFGEAY